jgi:hypothetical protein
MLKRILFLLLAVGVSFGLGVSLSDPSLVAATPGNNNGGGQEVCPEGNGWTKENWQDSWSSKTYNASSGKIISEVCVKGGNEIEYFTSDNTKVCWKVDFKNNDKEVKIEEKSCGGPGKPDISHISSPTPTPTPTPPVCPQSYSCSQCEKFTEEDTECNYRMYQYCLINYACGSDNDGSEWMCSCSSSPTPTPTPVVTPTPSPTPQTTPTPAPTPESKSEQKFKSSTDCDGVVRLEFTALRDDGSGSEDKSVRFLYNNKIVETKTNSEGKAKAKFDYAGEREARVEFDGQSKTTNVKAAENCPAVLGTSTAVGGGAVLGTSTLAATGISTDILMNLLGLSGTMLTVAGYTKYGKKN